MWQGVHTYLKNKIPRLFPEDSKSYYARILMDIITEPYNSRKDCGYSYIPKLCQVVVVIVIHGKRTA